ncbi:MAG: hypothetical protein K0Q73_7547, partial [Paenibacillus sp.]|nr:hypothetical protein [Paenibacillus sp.]
KVNTPTSADRSLRIEDTSSTLTAEATQTFAALSGTVVVEYKLMPGQNNVSLGGPYVFDTGTNDSGVVVFSSDGNIKAYNGATAASLQSYSAGVWYDIKLVLNTTTDKYDVYINGILKGNQYNFRKAVSSISKLKYFFGTTATGTMNVDDVRVYVE